MEAAFDEYLASTVVGTLSLALGATLAFLTESRGDRAMAFSWMLGSIGAIFGPHLAGHVDPDHISVAERLYLLPLAGIYLTTPAYIRHLTGTARMPDRTRKRILAANTIGSLIGVGMFAVALVRTDLFLNSFAQALDGWEDLRSGTVWLFGAPYLVAGAFIGFAWLLLAAQELDSGERVRAQLYAFSVVPLMLALVVALPGSIICFAIAVLCCVFGVLNHLTVQGERAAFLSRFLSPQVVDLVRLRGLNAVMQPQQVDLSVVCIDFRGFTSYTEAIPSQAVIDLISEYHEAVADAVARYDGMIKDYAGDGILILVGAPIPRPDHAVAAVGLAREAMAAAQRVTDRWATRPHPLGVGIGVASGRVTVGAIGDTARMDYTAVGTAVNLAARLCGKAPDGSVLLDEATAAAAPDAAVSNGTLDLKGLPSAVSVYTLT